MTRFARAKGSKSSNERAPEDSTPWEVMKEQLQQAKKESEDAKKREEAENQRIVNYENFLKEHKSQKRKSTWCDFPQTEINKTQCETPSKKKNKQKTHTENDQQTPANSTTVNVSIDLNIDKMKKKNQKKKKPEQIVQENEIIKPQSISKDTVENNAIEKSPKKMKLKKKKNEMKELSDSNHCIENDQPLVSNQNTKNKNKKKQKLASENNGSYRQENENVLVVEPHTNNNINNKQKKNKKGKKLVDGVPVRRKPIDDRGFQLIINGKEVELIRFDGFPIMKRDAERLDELKKNMIKKGIPKSEVNRTLKLERRRAEKALARLKRDVCYNCRKGGHNLSDCPDLKTKIPGVGAPDGVCFKCGSTEHRQFECKVQKDKEFRFATCFICKEPGHIARQCPDNPKGLYPNGGGCKLCGDVTHLRKDCPTTMGSKEDTSIKLQTLDSTDHLEGIEQKINTTPQETSKKPKKIKF